MKLYQGAFLIGLALVLSACGFLAPDGTVPGQPQQPIQEPPVPELEEPPDAFPASRLMRRERADHTFLVKVSYWFAR